MSDAVIPPYYDSLVAKLITRGRDRAEAIARMRRALEMFIVEGVKTSIPLHRRILADPRFHRRQFRYPFPRTLRRRQGFLAGKMITPHFRGYTRFWMRACFVRRT